MRKKKRASKKTPVRKKRVAARKVAPRKKRAAVRKVAPKKKRATKKKAKRRNPAVKDTQVAKAKKLFTNFHGDTPMRVSQLNLSDLHAGFSVGELLEIKYSTWRDGEKVDYVHRFGKRKPKLIASADGRMVLAVRNFRFTDRGFDNA